MKGIRAKATDKAGRRNMLSMRTATTAPAAKRTSEAQQTRAKIFLSVFPQLLTLP